MTPPRREDLMDQDLHKELFKVVKQKLREQRMLGSLKTGRLHQGITMRGLVESVGSAVADTSSGFLELVKLNRLDLAMETVVLDPQWGNTFTDNEKAAAWKRMNLYSKR